MDAAKKAEILARLEAWLDALDDDEPLPAGLDPALAGENGASPPDLAALAAAVTASARESAIVAKTMKRLSESVAELPGGLDALRARVDAIDVPDPEKWSRAVADARAEESQRSLRDLLEIYDRLERCAGEARGAVDALPVPARWGGGPRLLASVARGVELTLERLVEILERAGVHRIPSTGEVFDAKTMRAVDTVPAAKGRGAGTVVETIRAGFLCRGEVFRPAEVRVAHAAAGSRQEP
jgi:molecular chaperone GrpE (heat shock protein)